MDFQWTESFDQEKASTKLRKLRNFDQEMRNAKKQKLQFIR